MKRAAVVFSLLLLGSAVLGQVSLTAGPSPAPMGCPIPIVIANDTASNITLPNPCPYHVKDAGGTVVFSPICIQIIVDLPPGGALISFWQQQDDFGVQVPPGTYTVEALLPGVIMSAPVTLDPTVQAALIPLGPTRIGQTRQVFLGAPLDGGFPYLMGASGPPVSGGIPTCAGLVPLELDAILMLSLGPNPFFANFSGTLSNSGISTLPTITLPNDPGIIGLSFYLAFVVLDPVGACPVRTISAPYLNVIG
jgi:hypothetical protein